MDRLVSDSQAGSVSIGYRSPAEDGTDERGGQLPGEGRRWWKKSPGLGRSQSVGIRPVCATVEKEANVQNESLKLVYIGDSHRASLHLDSPYVPAGRKGNRTGHLSR